MLALEQVLGVNDLTGIRKCRRSNNSAVTKQGLSSSSRGCIIFIFEAYGIEGPHPGAGWNDDVDPLDFNQLKHGPWPQFYTEFFSAQAPS